MLRCGPPDPADEPGSREAATAGEGDWLAADEPGLLALHGAAAAALHRDGAGAAGAARNLAMLALVQQLLAARALVARGHVGAVAARAALRSERALGYLMGLSAQGGDPAPGQPPRRMAARFLFHLHETVFGPAEARRLEAARSGPDFDVVGDGFGHGLLAAEADLRGLRRTLAGFGAALPTRLLAMLPCAGLMRDPGDAGAH